MIVAIVPGSPAYIQRENVNVDVHIGKDPSCQEVEVALEVSANIGRDSIPVFKESKTVEGGGNEIAAKFSFEAPALSADTYKLVIIARARGCNAFAEDRVELPVFSNPINIVNVVIVWHNHQPPNYLPNGVFFADYPFRWVWYDLFRPYIGGGPYYIHAAIYRRFPKVKTTVHLSPSLLAQWASAIEHGYVLENGEKISVGDTHIEMIKSTLEEYRKLASEGTIEILTSVYAHTILGYLIMRFDMVEVVKDELALGIEITKKVMGYNPRGAWTPEMAWHNMLTRVYSDLGIEYTVLCGKSHFARALGDKGDIYEPYQLIYDGRSIKVLFRDQPISDLIGFRNNFATRVEALRAALDTVLEILSKRGIVTIALDGENWMIFSRYPHNTYPYFEQLYRYLDNLQSKGLLRSLTGYEAVKQCEDRCRKLFYLPINTWVNGFHKWDGELLEQRYMWFEVEKAYRRLKNYSLVLGKENKLIRDAYWALYHVIDSDYWWTEFWNPRVIKAWLDELHKTLDKAVQEILAV